VRFNFFVSSFLGNCGEEDKTPKEFDKIVLDNRSSVLIKQFASATLKVYHVKGQVSVFIPAQYPDSIAGWLKTKTIPYKLELELPKWKGFFKFWCSEKPN